MPLNPIRFANDVNEQFLNYQLTTFPLRDPDLAGQARQLLRGPLGTSPLIKGPYVSISRAFKMGRNLKDLADGGIVHPALPGLTEFPQMFAHQDEVLHQVLAGNHCLVSTGTGSGKTEAFLYPILNECLRLRDEGAPDGMVAIVVYPMNALAIDQLGRLRQMLAGSGVSFGMYIGSTPANEAETANIVKMKDGEDRAAYHRYVAKYQEHEGLIISPWEERLTERDMAEHPPRILLTNVNQLELLLTRGKDLGMFVGAPLKFLVFDEAHTYSGAVGAEVSCLIRRIRAFCGKSADEVICIGTSATITDPVSGEEAGLDFGHRFFGVDRQKVALVKEQYVDEEFPLRRTIPKPPDVDTVSLLDRVLKALEDEDGGAVLAAASELTGMQIEGDRWQSALYEALKANELVFTVFHHLKDPVDLREAVQRVAIRLGRDSNKLDQQAQGELLCYLALGAAAEREGDPLLRPKVHYFVKGMEGAVAHFEPADENSDEYRPKLYLSLADAMESDAIDPASCPPVHVCKNCGQHFFAGYYSGLDFDDRGEIVGGDAEGENVVWLPADEVTGARRVLFTNRFLAEADDSEEEVVTRLENKRFSAHFCHWCGALHRHTGTCANPKCKRVGKLVPVWAITRSEKLRTCPSCGQKGRAIGARVFEPVKPLRATTVSDVHILAQNMINAVEPETQRLIVFSDNRQDAAFQAGWMQDHARRYRLRHLMYDFIRECNGPCGLGDIHEHLLRLFKKDRELGRSLAPEVFAGRVEEYFGHELERDLRYYLRIALVMEWTTGFKQSQGLELWGLARIVYAGVDKDSPWIAEQAGNLGLEQEILAEGICSLVDSYRRNRIFYDADAPVFSRYWHESDEEVQRGFLPHMDFPPKGIKEQRQASDSKSYTVQFRSDRGQTLAANLVAKWGIPKDKISSFLESLWEYLTTEAKVLEPVTLQSNRGRPLPNAGGVFQVGSKSVGIAVQYVRYRCNACQRIHSRTSPGDACTAMHCKGKLIAEEPPADDYNVALLNLPFSMLSAQEHSAQVPAQTREAIEREFKSKNGRINCLVSTPTLELGVDIGALDMVLMRNAPPKSSNYWQRAGRAGRRYRMAVIYTYCRKSSHDSYFYSDPTAMLSGVIEAPRFNLRNEVMLNKHIHAAMISQLIRMIRDPSEVGISEAEAQELDDIRKLVLPDYISDYLFVDGTDYRSDRYDVSALSTVIERYKPVLVRAVRSVFATYWPESDLRMLTDDGLREALENSTDMLQEVVDRLHQRMMWAVQTRRNLFEHEQRGLLDEYEKRLRARCERYLGMLAVRDMSTYTLSVLATEGFLPGYGIWEGSIRAFASRSLSTAQGKVDFELPRPPSIAIREFVPGNMIYANSGRFRASLYHFPVGERQVEPESYTVDLEKERIYETTNHSRGQYGSAGVLTLSGFPICDLDIAYVSRITDEEENRFQLPVAILGYLKHGHGAGQAYKIEDTEVQFRTAQHLRLVNVGPSDRVRSGELGYPICTVCGASRSPYASTKELERFTENHKGRCGRESQYIAFSSDARVDGLLISQPDKASAVNLGEALRIGAIQLLEMDSEDLQILVMPRLDEAYDLFLYDPMPGGSGLLQQMIARWRQIVERAGILLETCPNACEKSCYACMRTYRNAFSHALLDRHLAAGILASLSRTPKFEREIEEVQDLTYSGRGQATNICEAKLREMLLQAGFPAFQQQKRLPIDKPYKSTTPDLYYEDSTQDIQLGVYLDGLSKQIHGSPERIRTDAIIRMQLEADGVDVVEIASSDLDDPEAMRMHYRRIATKLRRPDLREKFTF